MQRPRPRPARPRSGRRQDPAPAKAGVEWRASELYPRVGFILTYMSRPAENVRRFLKTSAEPANNGSM